MMCTLSQVGNVAFPQPLWGAWSVMYIVASNRMKFLPSFLGAGLGIWLAGLAITGIFLTGKHHGQKPGG